MNIFVLAGCMAAVVLAAVFVGYSFGVSAYAQDTPPAAPTVAVLQPDEPPPADTREVAPASASITEPSEYITIPGFERLTVRGNMLEAEGVTNPERNTCYFTIAFMLANGTEIYRSALLAPGESLGVVELTNPPVTGT